MERKRNTGESLGCFTILHFETVSGSALHQSTGTAAGRRRERRYYSCGCLSWIWYYCRDVAPEREMEKVLFAADELTGLIWAAALLRPSKSYQRYGIEIFEKEIQE